MPAASSCCFALVEIVLLYHEVVHQLNTQVRLRLDVVLHIDQSIDFYVNREAARSELSRDFLVYFNKHVVTALDDRFFRFFFADTVCEAQFVQRNLRH